MALFKILKGDSNNLPEVKATEGYAYFTPDDGRFYIDIDSSDTAVVGGSSQEVNADGQSVNRICINSFVLDCGNSTSITGGGVSAAYVQELCVMIDNILKYEVI